MIDASVVPKNKSMSRKYDESYIYFGFGNIFGEKPPQCVIS